MMSCSSSNAEPGQHQKDAARLKVWDAGKCTYVDLSATALIITSAMFRLHQVCARQLAWWSGAAGAAGAQSLWERSPGG